MTKTKKNRGLSKREQRETLNEIKRLLGKNYDEHQICEKMNIRLDVYQQYLRKIMHQEKVRFQNLDNYSVYADYLYKSKQMVKELDEIKTKFRNRGQWTALVAAVKQKKDIYDSVIKMGQDFGFIEKKATEVKVEGEVSFSTMSDSDVKQQIEEEVKKLHQLAQGNVVEMREELVGVTDEDVRKFVPANVIEAPKKEKSKKRSKVKSKMKVTLKKRF